MKLSISAMMVGSVVAWCPKKWEETFATMEQHNRKHVSIHTDEQGQTSATIKSWGTLTPTSVTAPMNMEECSFVFPVEWPGKKTEHVVPMKAKFFRDITPGADGSHARSGITLSFPKAPGVLASFPTDEWSGLGGHTVLPVHGDCTQLGHVSFTAYDMEKTGQKYIVHIKGPAQGQVMTVAGQGKGGETWGMETAFDGKTCSAMINMAPTLPGNKHIRKIFLTKQQDNESIAKKVPWGSFVLTDPTGRAAPINPQVQPEEYPVNRWAVVLWAQHPTTDTDVVV